MQLHRRSCIGFLALVALLSPTPAGAANVAVDPTADRRPVDPRVYGVNFGDPNLLDFPLRRWGGNSTTRYNWTNDVHNTASDYFFQNIPSENDPGTLPDGSDADNFLVETFANGGTPILTVPLIGWTPLSTDRNKRWGFSVGKYGAQTLDECAYYAPNPPFWCTPDSGNGECNTMAVNCVDGFIVNNDPADTSETIDATFVTDWMDHVDAYLATHGGQGADDVLWALDNEPMLWSSTHRDVAPTPLDYDGLWTRTVAVASAMKAAYPNAKVMGPVFWGWCAYFTSAADWTPANCLTGADRTAHGGVPLLEWYADQICDYETMNGVRLVDVLDVHYYPQGAGIHALGSDASADAGSAVARLQSLRELWDEMYTEQSWIAVPVYLVPRLKQLVADHCPGLEVALTEYRWGDDNGGTSALAHAEALAIFGREGLDIAARWEAPDPGTRVVDAFRLFLDYDGAGARILGTSVRATTDASPDTLGVYAIDGGASLHVLLFNHTTTSQAANVAVAGGIEGNGHLYRFTQSTALADGGTVTTTANGFSLSLPARSASLVVVPIALFVDGFESGGTGAWSSSVP